MKHICDENGCRIVSDEEYEKYMQEKNTMNKTSQKTEIQKNKGILKIFGKKYWQIWNMILS